jgi:hypothetical protein
MAAGMRLYVALGTLPHAANDDVALGTEGPIEATLVADGPNIGTRS